MRTVKEGDTATFIYQDPGLAVVAKTCPHRPQAIKKKPKNSLHAFPSEKHVFYFPFFFLNEATAGTPGMSDSVKRFTQTLNFQDLT